MIYRFVFLLNNTPTRKGSVVVVVPPQNFKIGLNFLEPIARNCPFFRLYVDASVVGVGAVVVEQITIFISTSKGVFVVVVVHSIRSLFHIQFIRVKIDFTTVLSNIREML